MKKDSLNNKLENDLEILKEITSVSWILIRLIKY